MNNEKDISEIINSFIKMIDNASKDEKKENEIRGGKDEN